jgi:hypothetical protein
VHLVLLCPCLLGRRRYVYALLVPEVVACLDVCFAIQVALVHTLLLLNAVDACMGSNVRAAPLLSLQRYPSRYCSNHVVSELGWMCMLRLYCESYQLSVRVLLAGAGISVPVRCVCMW